MSSIREDILTRAKECVCGQRHDDHGSAENNFSTIATMWNAYLMNHPDRDWTITAKDVAAMLALLKIARISTGKHGKTDNWIDLAGYAACGGEIETSSINLMPGKPE